ncbi:MAG: hypothetical protein ACRDZ2_04555 [Ilumatobacteraceae bacterium]
MIPTDVVDTLTLTDHQQDEYAMLTGPDVAIGIGQVEDYVVAQVGVTPSAYRAQRGDRDGNPGP